MLVMMKAMAAVALITLIISVATAASEDSSFLCPAAEAYGSKPMLDAQNDAVCHRNNTFLFTQLVTDYTTEVPCTMYCASCEAGACQRTARSVTCSNHTSSKCTLCADPPGCAGEITDPFGTSSAEDRFSRQQAVCTMLVIGAMTTVMLLMQWELLFVQI